MYRPRNSHDLSLTVVAGLALALALVAVAPASADGSFTFRLDPMILEGSYLEQDTDSSRSQEYRDLSDGFRLTSMALAGFTEDFRRQLRFEVVNGGKADAFYGLSYDVAGSWRMQLSYDATPHRFGDNGRLLWTETRPGVFELADPVQQALEVFAIANRSSLNFFTMDGALRPYLAAAQSVDLGLERRKSRATIDLGRSGAADWTIDYQRESRTGNRAYGAAFGFNNVTELPEPIDYDTSTATLSGNWRFSRGLVSAGYRYSTFENAVSTLYWDNPWRFNDGSDGSAYLAPGGASVSGASRGIADLSPDNESGALFATSRFDLGTAGWIQVSADWVKNSQDDPLLAYTLNTAIGPETGAPFLASDRANQPYGSADRESTTTKLVASWGARFGEGWQAGARYDYQDYSDDSDRFAFEGYVRYHAVWEEIGRITVPFSWTRTVLSANVDKDLGSAGTVGLEIRRTEMDREFRETEGTTEDILALNWDARLGRTLVRAKYETGKRDIDGHYEPEAAEASFLEHGPLTTQEGLRRYDQADRSLDRWNLSASMPFAETWNLTLRGTGYESDYDDSEFGLTGDEQIRLGFDIGWEIGAAGSLHFWGDRTDRSVSQYGRQSGGTVSSNPLDDWSIDFDETNDTFGLGWVREVGAWNGQVNGWWSRSDGEADVFSPAGGTPDVGTSFDNYEDYEILSLEGIVDYELTKNLSVGGRLLYEDFTIDTFIRQNLANYLPGALLIVANDGDYEAWSAGLRMSLRF